jgi:hypothetical protein
VPPFTSRFRMGGLVFLLAAGLAAALPSSAATASGPVVPATVQDGNTTVHAEVARKLQGKGKSERVRVIVSLDVPDAESAPRPREIRGVRSAVVGSLPAGSYDIRAEFDRIPAISLAVNANGLDALARNPRVTAVNADHEITLDLAEAHALTGSAAVQDLGIKGEGVTVAVIDSGVDVTGGVVHPGLAGDLLSQACFRIEGDCPEGAGSARDQNGHGTHVSGIITGPEGVAPASKFHALKVFTTGDTSSTNILNALNHVIGLNSATPGAVDLVNMSLGGADYPTVSACDAANAGFKNAFATLNSQGTAVFATTGNDASTTEVGAPGCVTGAIGVGSVGDANHTIGFDSCSDNGAPDKVSCFSNTTPVQGDGELVDLLAPGCSITSLWLAGGTATICGTSMASPYAAGVAGLMIEQTEGDLTPDELESLLEDSGKLVSDYRLGQSPRFPRVDALRARVAVLLPPPAALRVDSTLSDSVTLSWDEVRFAREYVLYRSRYGGEFEQVGSTADLTYVDSAVPCGEVTYVVRASVDGGESMPSASVSAAARSCPTTPADLTLGAIGPMTNRLQWTDANLDETEIILQRRREGQPFADHQTFGPGTWFEHADTLESCGFVAYRVVAVRGGDRSFPSPIAYRQMCAPDNDKWEFAAAIESVPYQTTFAGAQLASVDPADPAHPCALGGPRVGSHTLWWMVTPEFNGALDLNTLQSSGSIDDTVLSVWTGSPGNFTHVACNDDDSEEELRSRLTGVPVKAGTTYSVLVSHFDATPRTSPGSVGLAADFAADPAVVVSPLEVLVSENGDANTYVVRLATQPTADVDVSILGDADCTTDPTRLTFPAADWDQPQAVTVSAVDDGIVEGTHECTITHAVSSDDPDYDGLEVPDVTGTVTDADPPPVAGSPDGRTKKVPGKLVGDNIYGGPARQTVAAKVKPRKSVRFVVSAQNDAQVAERLRLKGGKSNRRFVVIYKKLDGTNVTRAVVAGRFRTPLLTPGTAYEITVIVKPRRTAQKGAVIKRPVAVFSTEVPTHRDTVAFQARRR